MREWRFLLLSDLGSAQDEGCNGDFRCLPAGRRPGGGNPKQGIRLMMDLAKLLKKREKPPGPAPQEWLLATKLPVPSGSLFIGDPSYDPADAYVVTVPPGTYQIDARLRDLGGEWYTARVRAILESCGEP